AGAMTPGADQAVEFLAQRGQGLAAYRGGRRGFGGGWAGGGGRGGGMGGGRRGGGGGGGGVAAGAWAVAGGAEVAAGGAVTWIPRVRAASWEFWRLRSRVRTW